MRCFQAAAVIRTRLIHAFTGSKSGHTYHYANGIFIIRYLLYMLAGCLNYYQGHVIDYWRWLAGCYVLVHWQQDG